MTNTEKTAIVAHLYILMRRKLNRIIDVEWLLHNDDYAREVIRLASQEEELAHYAERMQQLLFGQTPSPLQPVLKPEPTLVMHDDDAYDGLEIPAGRYVGTLR